MAKLCLRIVLCVFVVALPLCRSEDAPRGILGSEDGETGYAEREGGHAIDEGFQEEPQRAPDEKTTLSDASPLSPNDASAFNKDGSEDTLGAVPVNEAQAEGGAQGQTPAQYVQNSNENELGVLSGQENSFPQNQVNRQESDTNPSNSNADIGGINSLEDLFDMKNLGREMSEEESDYVGLLDDRAENHLESGETQRETSPSESDSNVEEKVEEPVATSANSTSNDTDITNTAKSEFVEENTFHDSGDKAQALADSSLGENQHTPDQQSNTENVTATEEMDSSINNQGAGYPGDTEASVERPASQQGEQETGESDFDDGETQDQGHGFENKAHANDGEDEDYDNDEDGDYDNDEDGDYDNDEDDDYDNDEDEDMINNEALNNKEDEDSEDEEGSLSKTNIGNMAEGTENNVMNETEDTDNQPQASDDTTALEKQEFDTDNKKKDDEEEDDYDVNEKEEEEYDYDENKVENKEENDNDDDKNEDKVVDDDDNEEKDNIVKEDDYDGNKEKEEYDYNEDKKEEENEVYGNGEDKKDEEEEYDYDDNEEKDNNDNIEDDYDENEEEEYDYDENKKEDEKEEDEYDANKEENKNNEEDSNEEDDKTDYNDEENKLDEEFDEDDEFEDEDEYEEEEDEEEEEEEDDNWWKSDEEAKEGDEEKGAAASLDGDRQQAGQNPDVEDTDDDYDNGDEEDDDNWWYYNPDDIDDGDVPVYEDAWSTSTSPSPSSDSWIEENYPVEHEVFDKEKETVSSEIHEKVIEMSDVLEKRKLQTPKYSIILYTLLIIVLITGILIISLWKNPFKKPKKPFLSTIQTKDEGKRLLDYPFV